MSLLDVIRAEYESVELWTAELDDEPGFMTLCPVCRQHSIVKVPSEDYGELTVWCRSGCERGRVADELDARRRRGEPWPKSPADNAVGERPRRLADMVEAFKTANDPIPWRCKPLMADGYLTVLAGKPGVDKSWLALAMCATVGGGGGGLAGLECRPGAALYVDGENGPRLLARRLMMLDAEPSWVNVADGFGMRLPKDVAELRELITYTGSKLVWLDSLRRLAPDAKENDSDYLAPIFAALAELARELEIAIGVIVHRSVKAGAGDFRGSSSIQDQADALWVLEKVLGDPERRSRRRLRCEKLRYDRDPAAHWITRGITAGFYTLGEAAAYIGADRDDGEAETAAHDELADRIRALAGQADMNGGWAPSRVAAAVGSTIDSGTFKRAIGMLLADGEWIGEGQGKARRLRPAEPGQPGHLLRDGQVGQVDDEHLFGSEEGS